MKRFFCIVLTLALAACIHAQNPFASNPLPSNPDTLRILAIGNSFSDDGTEYLPALLESAGVKNVIVARLYIGGCSLERHCKEYNQGLANYIYYKSTSNSWRVAKKAASLLDGLRDEPWDIITMQETSGLSGIYDNYQEWLPQLIGIVRKEAVNPRATIAWHQTWAYSRNSDHGSFPLYDRDQMKMYDGIQSCVDRLKSDYNIQVVIPSGVAVQYARGTRVNNIGRVPAASGVYDLTRDGYHLNRQFGRYVAACTWFEALIKPTVGKSVKGNPCRLADTEFSISDKDARLLQKCAVKAVKAVLE